MTKPVLFISYSHKDNLNNQWRERLAEFLGALRETLPLSVWEDSKIEPGARWRDSIVGAIGRARAAVLLVGSGFLNSPFIRRDELGPLLHASEAGKVKLYFLVVGACPWQESVLAPYQAFNDPDQPLESLSAPEQNAWLNKLCISIARDMRAAKVVPQAPNVSTRQVYDAMSLVKDHLDTTRAAFVAQAQLRDELVRRMKERLGVDEALEYEQFFFRYYRSMNEEERFGFTRIRAYTEGPLRDGNAGILEVLAQHPELRDELPILSGLRTHLIVWLSKFDRVFARTKEMCLVYVGVEDGIPFPFGVDRAVADWLGEHPRSSRG